MLFTMASAATVSLPHWSGLIQARAGTGPVLAHDLESPPVGGFKNQSSVYEASGDGLLWPGADSNLTGQHFPHDQLFHL